jgi:hypothetical protein
LFEPVLVGRKRPEPAQGGATDERPRLWTDWKAPCPHPETWYELSTSELLVLKWPVKYIPVKPIDYEWLAIFGFVQNTGFNVRTAVRMLMVRRHMRIIIFTGLLLFCVGCRHGYPITNQAPFASYLGHDLTLKQNTLLMKPSGFFERTFGPLDMEDASITNSVGYLLGYYGYIAAILPPGTVVRLDRIDFAWDEDAWAGSFLAFGKTTLPETERNVTFRYFWGMPDIIGRAPWDDDTVPSKRDAHFEPRWYRLTFAAANPPIASRFQSGVLGAALPSIFVSLSCMKIRQATIADIPALVALNRMVQTMHVEAFPGRRSCLACVQRSDW